MLKLTSLPKFVTFSAITLLAVGVILFTGIYRSLHSDSYAAKTYTPAYAPQSITWLHVEGKDIKDTINRKVVLRGVSLTDLATNAYRKGAGKSAVELIDLLTDREQGWYSTVIRLPVYPIWNLGYNANPTRYYNTYIKPSVDRCIERQVYCIIDWHYVRDPRDVDVETRAFWSDVAPKLKDYPNIIFEVFNENDTKMSWAEWKRIVQPWVDLIRSYAPKNLILVGAPSYAQHLYDAPKDLIEGEQIAYVAHIYPALKKFLWNAWIFNVADEIPIVVTEWGFRKGADYPTSGTISSFGRPLKKKLEKYNLSWTSWVADYEWQPEMFDRNWNLLVGENYMGGFVKDYLYEKRRK